MQLHCSVISTIKELSVKYLGSTEFEVLDELGKGFLEEGTFNLHLKDDYLFIKQRSC